jgi:hypothetical protein
MKGMFNVFCLCKFRGHVLLTKMKYLISLKSIPRCAISSEKWTGADILMVL